MSAKKHAKRYSYGFYFTGFVDSQRVKYVHMKKNNRIASKMLSASDTVSLGDGYSGWENR
jgi:hypothetical protein